VTVLPRLVIGGAESDLRFLPVADPSARRPIEILRRAHASSSPATRSFEKVVRRTAREVVSTW
jgi:DNA-binding transcriptional LysR family regulator